MRPAYGQSLKDLLNKETIKNVVGTVVEELDVIPANIEGRWSYSGIAVRLTGDDMLTNAASALACSRGADRHYLIRRKISHSKKSRKQLCDAVRLHSGIFIFRVDNLARILAVHNSAAGDNLRSGSRIVFIRLFFFRLCITAGAGFLPAAGCRSLTAFRLRIHVNNRRGQAGKHHARYNQYHQNFLE